MVAESLISEISTLLLAIAAVLGAVVAVCKSLKLKRTAKVLGRTADTLKAVTGQIEAFDPNAVSIDAEGTSTIDPRKNLKMAISEKTQELRLHDILDKALKE